MVFTRRSLKINSKRVKEETSESEQENAVISDQESITESNDDDDFQTPIPFNITKPTLRTTRSSSAAAEKGKSRMNPDITALRKSKRVKVMIKRHIFKTEGSPGSSSISSTRSSTAFSIKATERKKNKNDDDDTVDTPATSVSNTCSSSPCAAVVTDEETEFKQLVTEEQLERQELGNESESEQVVERTASPTENTESEEEVSSSDSDSEDNEPIQNRRARGRTEQTQTNSRQNRHYYSITQKKVIAQRPELADVWKNLKETEAEAVTPIEQPKELSLSLLPFQKYGVGWMIRQEHTEEFRGGILADEMGMGKTIQTIALLLSDKKSPNLVIAPTVAILQWKSEIERHTNNALSVHVFHGAKRSTDQVFLENFDVVLTTYSIMETAFRRQEYGVKKIVDGDTTLVKEKSVLHKIQWHRIILDEAHNIKDRSCNTARSVFNLNGKFKWSLSGTPLQNRVGELYSLIRFMQADPFAYYYCVKCPCKELSWRFSNKKGCDTCGHTPMSHTCWWNNEVLKPIQKNGYIADGREALKKLTLLLDKIMLRRTKVQCADDLGLPPRTVILRRDVFSEEEEDVYTSLYSDVARTFTTYVEQGTVLNNYANIFELLMKMRQCADHPDLVTKKGANNQQLVCMLCNDPPEDAIAAACKHVFCRECCVQYYESFDDSNTNERARCPSCFAEFTVDLSQPPMELDTGGGLNANYSKSSIVNRINMDKWRSSTKIEALVEELSKLKREDKTIKSIVFSQFVNFLDLVYWRLSRAGYECIRLDGTMTPDQRAAAIRQFTIKPSVTVFLISLKAGGVALNLTEASRVFICDPWWNPATELQAMDRIHRLGQHRPIRITRLVIENSIESRIIQLQEKKTALVESTVGKNDKALDSLTVEDLRFLFVM